MRLTAFIALTLLATSSHVALAAKASDENPALVGYVDNAFIVVLEEGYVDDLVNKSTARRGRKELDDDDKAKDDDSLTEEEAFSAPWLESLVWLYDAGVEKQFPDTEHGADDDNTERALARYYRVEVDPDFIDEAMGEFAADANVAEVQAIEIYEASALEPNDFNFICTDDPDTCNPATDPDQWHLRDLGGIDADWAWEEQTGSPDVVVAIIDAGVRYYHADLGGDNPPWGPNDIPQSTGNIWINQAETLDGLDSDGSGYADDVIGWDYVDMPPFVNLFPQGIRVECIDEDCENADNDPDDWVDHGTHIAGILAAITNNGDLVAGVAGGWGVDNPGVKILPIRIGFRARKCDLDPGTHVCPEPVNWEEGTFMRQDYLAQAIRYVAKLIDNGANIVAINYAASSGEANGVRQAVDYLFAERQDGTFRDVTIVAAAGNRGDDPEQATNTGYLGSRVEPIVVAGTDRGGLGGAKSSYGPTVDIAAPAIGILSTTVDPTDDDLSHHYIGTMNGTSMAAPQVAGILALLESQKPDLDRDTKRAIVTAVENTTPYDDSANGNRNLGSGIANAYLSLQAIMPTAGFSYTVDGLTLTFIDESSDPAWGGDTIVAWSWDFGDGNTATGPNPVHTYAARGDFTVTLTVTDDAGASAEASQVVEVEAPAENDPPTAAAGPDQTVQDSDGLDGESVTLDGSLSSDTDGTITGYAWTWSDDNASGPTPTVRLPDGTTVVTLIVTDDDGASSDPATVSITVEPPPTIHVGDLLGTSQRFWWWWRATVEGHIQDADGVPISGATVTGDWSNGGSGSCTTSNGTCEITSRWSSRRRTKSITFTVTGVSHASYAYEEAANEVSSIIIHRP